MVLLGRQSGLTGLSDHTGDHASADCVTEMIDGMVETFQGLQRLDGFPEVRLYVELVFPD